MGMTLGHDAWIMVASGDLKSSILSAWRPAASGRGCSPRGTTISDWGLLELGQSPLKRTAQRLHVLSRFTTRLLLGIILESASPAYLA